jgi:SPP1 family predicted phage head-tail adaptor
MSLGARLNKRIAIQERVDGRDDSGQPTDNWTDVVTDSADGKCWAAIRDVSGKEFITADATQSMVTTRITIRRRAGIAAAMRVLYGADTYMVAAVLGQADRTLLLMCSRGIR